MVSYKKKYFDFTVGGEILKVDLFYNKSELHSNILFLHGAGTSNRKRVSYLRNRLALKGCSSVAFDFSGHGESSGKIEDSSLAKRLKEAYEIAFLMRMREPLTVIASSMGGHIAISLTNVLEVKNLILFCPALYSRDAFDVKFDIRFSEIIRKELSWEDSDAYDQLKKFEGNLWVLIGEWDKVIPKGVISKIDENAVNANWKSIEQIPRVGHHIHSWLSNDENKLDNVTDKIIGLLK